MTDKYEKITGMTVGQVVDAAYAGEKFYMAKDNLFHKVDYQDLDIFALDDWLKQGLLYRKIETPWWEKHVGGLVMVRDDRRLWSFRIFENYDDSKPKKFIDAGGLRWQHMRPLTAAEKDAIITEG